MRRRSGTKVMAVIAVVAALCAVLRLFAVGEVASLTGSVLSDFVSQDGMAQQLIGLELSSGNIGTTLASAFFTLPQALLERSETDEPSPALDTPTSEPSTTAPPVSVPEIRTAPEATPEPGELFYNGADVQPTAPDGIDNSAPLPSDGMAIQNNSGLEIDIQALLSEPLELELAEDGPMVLIIHTHGSEAYTQAKGEEYEESDPYRTQDKSKSVIYVGDVLAEELSARGISVVHDRETYDYPSYAGSYNRTLEAIESYLDKYPSISLVIDLHRDAQQTSDGSQYKTIAEIGDTRCAQVMFFVGTNSSGLVHPEWEENMKLALRLQYEMDRSFPTLARPMTVAQYRYNQHMTTGSLLVEVGAAGNTLSESVTAVKYFAEAYANVILASR